MYTHLQRRGNVYQIRRRIPIDLQKHYGRKEILRSLGTRDPVEARLRLRAVGVLLDEEFLATRAAISAKVIPGNGEARPVLAVTAPGRKKPVILSGWDLPPKSDVDSSHPWQVEGIPRSPKKQSISLVSLLEKWASERKPALRTIGQMRKVVGRFTAHVGEFSLEDITRRHVVEFKEQLLASGQTPINTDKQLVLLSTLLNYATLNSMIEQNFARGINVGERKNAKAARLPFDQAALKAIFSSPIFTEGLRPGAGAGEAAYWLPILALFTGARVEELCQLRPDDVFEDSYFDENANERKVWVLRITDEGDGQALKTQGSRRRFPIHAEILKLGFLKFVRSAEGRARIFHELHPDTMGNESGNWSKWFGKYLRKVAGVTDKRMVFHSFRHKFKDVARECEIPEDVSDAITGHSNGNVARRYGGLTYPLRPLVEAMNRYRITGIRIGVQR